MSVERFKFSAPALGEMFADVVHIYTTCIVCVKTHPLRQTRQNRWEKFRHPKQKSKVYALFSKFAVVNCQN